MDMGNPLSRSRKARTHLGSLDVVTVGNAVSFLEGLSHIKITCYESIACAVCRIPRSHGSHQPLKLRVALLV
jgi:hypothetical protein